MIELEDFSSNNKIIINKINFSYNQIIPGAKNSYGAAGGGVRISFVIFDQNTVEKNSVMFQNCLFTGNDALWGGGFGMYIPSEPNVVNATNSLSFNNCSWDANKGMLGSAVGLNYWNIHNYGAKMQVEFSACKFHNNNNNTKIKDVNTFTTWDEYSSFGTGALYAKGIPIIFKEYVEFSSNNDSALAVYDTTATFASNCNASFVNNIAWEGGAIILLGASSIWINPYTMFLFKNNKADLRGGAIYVSQTSRHDLVSDGNCFLRYSDISVCSPNEWMTNFTFRNNYAPTGSSTFATSLLSCAFEELNLSISDALNWTNFSYDPSDSNAIATEISKISLQVNTIPIELIPGQLSKLPITTVDDKGNNISQSFWLISKNDSVKLAWDISDNSYVILHGKPNSNTSIKIVTESPRVISANIPVKLGECPPGYYFDEDKNQTCKCSYSKHAQHLDGILSCDSETFTAKIKRGYWAGYYLSSEHPTPTDKNLIAAQCPRRYCGVKGQDIHLPNKSNTTLLNAKFCSPSNRNGTLCGMCSNGYSVAINSLYFECINCSDSWLSQHGWITYVLTQLVPLTAFVYVILYFDFNPLSGIISLIVLYFQIFNVLNIYSDEYVNPPKHSSILLTIINFLYSIWNLEFIGSLLPVYCIDTNLNTMDVLLIKYVSLVYCFILFLLFAVLSKYCKFNYCKFNYCKFNFCNFEFTNGLAALYTLVFTKFTILSLLILSPKTLSGSQHSKLKLRIAWLNGNLPYGGTIHSRYMIPAIFFLFFVSITAAGLLLYPLMLHLCVQRIVDITQCNLCNSLNGRFGPSVIKVIKKTVGFMLGFCLFTELSLFLCFRSQ